LKQSGATAFIPRIWSALKSFDEQAAFGLPYERLIAQMAALLLYPHRLDLTLVRLDAYAALDFCSLTARRRSRRWKSSAGRCALIRIAPPFCRNPSLTQQSA
jgi:hypothetical protein